jgi:hypothetical protein
LTVVFRTKMAKSGITGSWFISLPFQAEMHPTNEPASHGITALLTINLSVLLEDCRKIRTRMAAD